MQVGGSTEIPVQLLVSQNTVQYHPVQLLVTCEIWDSCCCD